MNPYTGNCFRFVSTPLSWSEARASCEAADEHLATFDTIEAAAWFRHQQLTGGKSHWTVFLGAVSNKQLNLSLVALAVYEF